MAIVIHFGKRICQRVYDHGLDPVVWSKIKETLPLPCLQPCEYFKSYQIDSLVYEFNKEGKYICYSDTISSINSLRITDALTYQRHHVVFHDEVFQPLNLYYNITEGYRTIHGNDAFKVIFEKKGDTHEIYVEAKLEVGLDLEDKLKDQILLKTCKMISAYISA